MKRTEGKLRELGIRTFGEVLEDAAAEVVRLLTEGTTSGPWTFLPDVCIVEHTNGYYIDISDLSSAAQILDWVIQLADKTWCSHEDIGRLVRLLNSILKIQGNYCPGGADRRVASVRMLLEKRLQLARDHLIEVGHVLGEDRS
jgi:hypothetical protein